MPYTPLVGTLGYILGPAPSRSHVLLVHRNARPNDTHFGKYNGLGGKLHADEDVYSCMVREIREEAGIEVESMRLRGTINWTGFGPHNENWLGFIFLIDRYRGVPFPRNAEGELCWIPLTQLADLPMWEGDRYFLPLVFDDDPRPFHGVMPYANDTPLAWSFQR